MKYKVNYKSAVYCKNMVDLFINNIISHHDDVEKCYDSLSDCDDDDEREAIREEIKIHREAIQELTDAIKDMVPAVECNGVSYATKEDFEANDPNKVQYYDDARYTAIRECLEENHDGCLDLDKEADPVQCFEAKKYHSDGTCEAFGCCRLVVYDTEVHLCGEKVDEHLDLAGCPEVVWDSVEEVLGIQNNPS